LRLSLLLLIVSIVFSYTQHANALECLPTCSSVDGRFLAIAGINLSTIVGAEIVVNLVSRGDSLEFGIFDGEAGENWDFVANPENKIQLKYELYADPSGDSSGLSGPVIATWTSDGSVPARNAGMPMNNNNWSDFTFPNIPGAQAPNGDYVYTLQIKPIDPDVPGSTENVFKIRAEDMLYVPAMFPITFITPFGGQDDLAFFREDIMILYPNATLDIDTGSTCGLQPGEICDLNDPSCCLFETTYDGIWSFFMNVPEGESGLDVWDGDLDYGDFAGTVFDTDDPNTPGDPFLPPWSIGTDVVFETARPADPHDNNGDSNEFVFVRDPSIQYFVIDPLGNSYQNFNPSGDREWELFRLDTTTDNPAVAEYKVSSIPPGLWEVRLVGVDMSNLNSILLPFDLRGEIVKEPPPAEVPTLGEWGLVTLSVFVLMVSVLYLRGQRETGVKI